MGGGGGGGGLGGSGLVREKAFFPGEWYDL